MKPTTVLFVTILVDMLALIISVLNRDLFSVICFGVILMGIIFYYMENPR